MVRDASDLCVCLPTSLKCLGRALTSSLSLVQRSFERFWRSCARTWTPSSRTSAWPRIVFNLSSACQGEETSVLGAPVAFPRSMTRVDVSQLAVRGAALQPAVRHAPPAPFSCQNRAVGVGTPSCFANSFDHSRSIASKSARSSSSQSGDIRQPLQWQLLVAATITSAGTRCTRPRSLHHQRAATPASAAERS